MRLERCYEDSFKSGGEVRWFAQEALEACDSHRRWSAVKVVLLQFVVNAARGDAEETGGLRLVAFGWASAWTKSPLTPRGAAPFRDRCLHTKCSTRDAKSEGRSRKGGIRIGKTRRR